MHINKVIGYQQFVSSALVSAVAISTTLLRGTQGEYANAALLSVFASTVTSGVRFADDGTVPTASVGHFLAYGTPPFLYQGDLTKVKFILGVGNPDLNVTLLQVSDS